MQTAVLRQAVSRADWIPFTGPTVFQDFTKNEAEN